MIPILNLLSQPEKYPEFTQNILEAAEAGLWGINPRHLEIDCLVRPVIRSRLGQLHNDKGPALVLGRTEVFYWNGVHVDPYVVLEPQKITTDRIAKEWNVERRRVLLERMGYERYFKESNSVLVHEDEYGKLYRVTDRENTTTVMVKNGSPEPDGTHKWYWLRVPPEMRTAKEAVAWTYGMSADQYKPKLRT